LSRVHIVEDDPEISALLSTYLHSRGFTCVISGSAEAALHLSPEDFDIMVVDIMLPGDSGLSYCKRVREQSNVPLVILSAVKGDTERIIGIELGADDYLEKPFNPRELLARMNALLRRANGAAKPTARTSGRIGFSGWILDHTNHKLHGPNAIHVPLSSTEYRLMTMLVSVAPAPVAREDIARSIIGIDLDPEDRRVDILVSRLRKKLMNTDPSGDFIRTIRNQGYHFAANYVLLD
jgi:two-component system OmpR family response regulator